MPAFGGANFHSSYTNWNFQAKRGSTSERNYGGQQFQGNQMKMRNTITGFGALAPSSKEDLGLYNALNNLNVRRISKRQRANVKILDRMAESDDEGPELFTA